MIKENYRHLLERIAESCRRVGRDPGEVKIIAVSKRFPPETINHAVELGIRELGENRIQEAVEKIPQVKGEVNWHFVGHLQSNKVKEAVQYFSLIHSLDRYSLARELDRRARLEEKKVRALVQVDVAGEETKHGLSPQDLKEFVEEVSRWGTIKIEGLMTMAPFVEDPEEVRPFFRQMRKLRDSVKKPGLELPHLSMGMTNDFTVAVEEGATMVRIGTALFGSRQTN